MEIDAHAQYNMRSGHAVDGQRGGRHAIGRRRGERLAEAVAWKCVPHPGYGCCLCPRASNAPYACVRARWAQVGVRAWAAIGRGAGALTTGRRFDSATETIRCVRVRLADEQLMSVGCEWTRGGGFAACRHEGAVGNSGRARAARSHGSALVLAQAGVNRNHEHNQSSARPKIARTSRAGLARTVDVDPDCACTQIEASN